MEKRGQNKRLLEYNRIFKENDEIYRRVARELELPDCAFWIIYLLREGVDEPTQRGICKVLYQPKQTINSSLKKLEEKGYIKLTEGKDRRSKQIYLTKEGEKLAERTVDRVVEMECRALESLEEKEQEEFLFLFRKYTNLLKENMRELERRKKN